MNDLVNKVIDFLRGEETLIKGQLKNIRDSFKGMIDVRLCIELSDSGMSPDLWCVLYGDSSYDQRHYSICAASVLDTRSVNIDSLFEELLNQCLDHASDIHS